MEFFKTNIENVVLSLRVLMESSRSWDGNWTWMTKEKMIKGVKGK